MNVDSNACGTGEDACRLCTLRQVCIDGSITVGVQGDFVKYRDIFMAVSIMIPMDWFLGQGIIPTSSIEAAGVILGLDLKIHGRVDTVESLVVRFMPPSRLTRLPFGASASASKVKPDMVFQQILTCKSPNRSEYNSVHQRL